MNTDEMIINEYYSWCDKCADDPFLAAELNKLKDNDQELIECFYDSIRFGTSGMRGLIGAGPNRLNKYVIIRATQGLADHIKNTAKKQRVVIGYDSRRFSKEFAETAAKVMSGNGITAYLFDALTPVPVLSYAIDKLDAAYGIMITASHNPSDYNGYKVYSQDGYQIVGDDPDEILKAIEAHDYFDDIPMNKDLIESVGEHIGRSFIRDVVSTVPDVLTPSIKENIKIIYTPLNGTGNRYVRKALADFGFTDVSVVSSQELPDENFTTCKTPNPEKLTVYTEAFRLLDRKKADIIIATDPDCDRVGCALIHDGMKVNLSGNQIGILMLDFLCRTRPSQQGSVCIKSIASTPLFDKIASAYGMKVVDTLTGFKHMGKHISDMIKAGDEDKFFFAFEESNGFLISPFIRDKDGVSSALLISAMAAYYKSMGMDLITRLDQIYQEYGTFLDRSRSFEFEGIRGRETMGNIMEYFRGLDKNDMTGLGIAEKTDYLKDDTGLPKSDVIRFAFSDKSIVIVRPSGTESKIKTYFYLSKSGISPANEIIGIIESFKLY